MADSFIVEDGVLRYDGEPQLKLVDLTNDSDVDRIMMIDDGILRYEDTPDTDGEIMHNIIDSNNSEHKFSMFLMNKTLSYASRNIEYFVRNNELDRTNKINPYRVILDDDYNSYIVFLGSGKEYIIPKDESENNKSIYDEDDNEYKLLVKENSSGYYLDFEPVSDDSDDNGANCDLTEVMQKLDITQKEHKKIINLLYAILAN